MNKKWCIKMTTYVEKIEKKYTYGKGIKYKNGKTKSGKQKYRYGKVVKRQYSVPKKTDEIVEFQKSVAEYLFKNKTPMRQVKGFIGTTMKKRYISDAELKEIKAKVKRENSYLKYSKSTMQTTYPDTLKKDKQISGDKYAYYHLSQRTKNDYLASYLMRASGNISSIQDFADAYFKGYFKKNSLDRFNDILQY